MWFFIAGLAIALLATYVLAPKPQTQPPAAFEDVEVPTAEEGKEVPVLFGTRDIRGPNVVWYGDFRSVAIKKSGGKK